MHIAERSLDDLLRTVTRMLLARKSRVSPRRGKMAEVLGVMLELKDPRSRLSRSESRGKAFSGLGELLWYLSKTNNLNFIRHYLSHYEKESDDGVTVYSGYGPRLFGMRGLHNQIANVTAVLKKRPASRRAVIQLFDAADIAGEHKEIPCTCTLQFVIRDNRMHLLTHMRSNDAYLGLPHDVFAFTMLQEIMAVKLGVNLGTYKHFVGSLHLYNIHRKKARSYLREGVQSHISMPKMPFGDPWPSIKVVLAAELALRNNRDIKVSALRLQPYWADLVRLLQIHQWFKIRKYKEIQIMKMQLSTQVYDAYIADRSLRSVSA